MTTSFLLVEMKTLFSLEWKETGLREEEFSTTKARLLLFGLMRKINWESSVCNKEEMSIKSLKDFPNWLDKLRKALTSKEKNSLYTNNTDTYLLAPLTWEQEWEPVYWFTYQDSPKKTRNYLSPDARLLAFNPEDPEEKVEVILVTSMIFLINTDLDTAKSN